MDDDDTENNDADMQVRIQYKDVPGDIFGGNAIRNELVVRVQPNESVYAKVDFFQEVFYSFIIFSTGDDEDPRHVF